MPISLLPEPPSRSDPANFAARGDAFLGQINTFATQANALEANVNDNESKAYNWAVAANADSAAATASANAAAAYVGAVAWVSGTSYTINSVVFSPTTRLIYRRTTAGAGTTDPASDSANWTLVASGLRAIGVSPITPSKVFNINEAGFLWYWNDPGAGVCTLPAVPGYTATFSFTNLSDGPLIVNRAGSDVLYGFGLQAATQLILRRGDTLMLAAQPGGVWMQVAGVRSGLGKPGRVRGLLGARNAGAPNTKFDIVVSGLTLTDAFSTPYELGATTILTCDLGAAGPVANGRDQAGTFPAGRFINLFFIFNPVTNNLATLASVSTATANSGPAPVPTTLPAGYTMWAYATTVRWGASSTIVPQVSRGPWIHYDLQDGDINRLVSAGAALTFTGVPTTDFIPPFATLSKFAAQLAAGLNSGQGLAVRIRPVGSSHSGQVKASMANTSPNAGAVNSSAEFTAQVAGNGTIEYLLSSAPINGGVSIDVLGYVVPNGDC